jgi:hypothetical protein
MKLIYYDQYYIFSNRIMEKRINVRVEHVHPSGSRMEFLKRCKTNDEQKRAYKEGKAEYVSLKRKVCFSNGCIQLSLNKSKFSQWSHAKRI